MCAQPKLHIRAKGLLRVYLRSSPFPPQYRMITPTQLHTQRCTPETASVPFPAPVSGADLKGLYSTLQLSYGLDKRTARRKTLQYMGRQSPRSVSDMLSNCVNVLRMEGEHAREVGLQLLDGNVRAQNIRVVDEERPQNVSTQSVVEALQRIGRVWGGDDEGGFGLDVARDWLWVRRRFLL